MRRSELERKHIVWTAEKSNRLYDFLAEKEYAQSDFFGYQVKEAIFNIVKQFVDITENINYLDYGCGGGYIIQYFLENANSVKVYGTDMSPSCVMLCNDKLKNYENFKGVKKFDGNSLPFSDNFFHVITATEVVEHLLPEHRGVFFREVKRVLKPNGIFLITTPNEEDFVKNEIICPECSTVFHKHGHCNWFSKNSLSKMLEKYGYTTIICEPTDFWRFQRTVLSKKIIDWSVRYVGTVLKEYIKMIWQKFIPVERREYFMQRCGEGYNLFWIGKK